MSVKETFLKQLEYRKGRTSVHNVLLLILISALIASTAALAVMTSYASKREKAAEFYESQAEDVTLDLHSVCNSYLALRNQAIMMGLVIPQEPTYDDGTPTCASGDPEH